MWKSLLFVTVMIAQLSDPIYIYHLPVLILTKCVLQNLTVRRSSCYSLNWPNHRLRPASNVRSSVRRQRYLPLSNHIQRNWWQSWNMAVLNSVLSPNLLCKCNSTNKRNRIEIRRLLSDTRQAAQAWRIKPRTKYNDEATWGKWGFLELIVFII